MDIFVDSANVKEIERWVNEGIADGVTTNPSIFFTEGVTPIETGVRQIIDVVGGRPVSVEVTTNDQAEMLSQARTFATWAPNIVVKIPVINEYGEPCLGVIKTLHTEGIKVNTRTTSSSVPHRDDRGAKAARSDGYRPVDDQWGGSIR